MVSELRVLRPFVKVKVKVKVNLDLYSALS